MTDCVMEENSWYNQRREVKVDVFYFGLKKEVLTANERMSKFPKF